MMQCGFWIENVKNKDYSITNRILTINHSITIPWTSNCYPDNDNYVNLSNNYFTTLQIKTGEVLTLTLPEYYILETSAINIQKFGNDKSSSLYKGSLYLVIPRMSNGSCGILFSIINRNNIDIDTGIYSGSISLYCNTLGQEFIQHQDSAAGIIIRGNRGDHIDTHISIKNTSLYIYGNVKCQDIISKTEINNLLEIDISTPEYVYQNIIYNIKNYGRDNRFTHNGWCSLIMDDSFRPSTKIGCIENCNIVIDCLMGSIIMGIIINRNLIIDRCNIKVSNIYTSNYGGAIIFGGNSGSHKDYDIIKNSRLEIGDVILSGNNVVVGMMFSATDTLIKNSYIGLGNLDNKYNKNIIGILFNNTIDIDNSHISTGGIIGSSGIGISFKYHPNIFNNSSIIVKNSDNNHILDKSVGILFLNRHNTRLIIKKDINISVFNIPYNNDNYISIQIGRVTHNPLNTNNTGLVIFNNNELLHYGSITLSNTPDTYYNLVNNNDYSDICSKNSKICTGKVICSYILGTLTNYGKISINNNILNSSIYKSERVCKKLG